MNTPYHVDLLTEIETEASLLTAVQTAVQAALQQQNAPENATLSILITDDAQLRTLNHSYRGIDKPTDVLSFPAPELPPEVSEDPYLGDIAISLPTAQKQAQADGHSLQEELQLLSVHGTLHLLGYDHEEADEQDEMWGVQNEILALLGVSIRSPE